MLSHELMRACQDLWESRTSNLLTEVTRRGRIAGKFHRRPKPPCKAGRLLDYWKHGVRLGNDDRDNLKPKPTPKPPTGGRRLRLTA